MWLGITPSAAPRLFARDTAGPSAKPPRQWLPRFGGQGRGMDGELGTPIG